MNSTKCFAYRPHDYMYDPIFTVSGPVDHYKAAIAAKMSSVKFQVCPIFPNMFSDLPNHPRVQLVQRRTKPIQTYQEKLECSEKIDPALRKSIDIRGADRVKFFCPIINLPSKDFRGCCDFMPRFTIERVQKTYEGDRRVSSRQENSERRSKVSTRDVQVGTIYRESATQTIPWQPPYKIIGKGDPEILKLEFLKWGSGLPAGMHEVRIIERARMKRSWENCVKPDIKDETSLQRFRDYVEALERDEWAFREKEIQEIQDLRLHLLEKMLAEIHETSFTRAEQKLNKIIDTKEQEKREKLQKIRKKAARELRKLELEERGVSRKYREPDVIYEHTSRKSELYAPLMRNGEHPKRWHQVIDERMKKYRAQFIGVEQFSTLPRWLDQATQLKGTEKKSKSAGPQLCIRETKWTAPVLKELHEELLNLRKETVKKPCTLRIRNKEAEMKSFTPEVEGIPEVQEEQYQAIIYLQSIIKGRATQMLIYEGRENCKELIQELKNSIGLLKKQKELRSKEKMKVRAQQREETIQSVMVSRLQGTLGKLQGQVVGSILDFLNKELRRLLEERKAHAMCWVNERERNIREAAEAGRRQKEIRRRKEHDEIFRQVVKVTQESVDIYLQEIITEGMEFASKEEATNYVVKLAGRIEREVNDIDKAYSMKGVDEEDELIADLVHHFVLPEVQKEMVRKRIVAKQKQNLKTIHETVYSKFENLRKLGKDELKSEWEDSDYSSSAPTIEYYKIKLEEESAYDTELCEGESVLPADMSFAKSEIVEQEGSTHPDVLELYLNMLAVQDQIYQESPEQESFVINERVPIMGEGRIHRTFNNDLDTIPESEHETATTINDYSASLNNIDNKDNDDDMEFMNFDDE